MPSIVCQLDLTATPLVGDAGLSLLIAFNALTFGSGAMRSARGALMAAARMEEVLFRGQMTVFKHCCAIDNTQRASQQAMHNTRAYTSAAPGAQMRGGKRIWRAQTTQTARALMGLMFVCLQTLRRRRRRRRSKCSDINIAAGTASDRLSEMADAGVGPRLQLSVKTLGGDPICVHVHANETARAVLLTWSNWA